MRVIDWRQGMVAVLGLWLATGVSAVAQIDGSEDTIDVLGRRRERDVMETPTAESPALGIAISTVESADIGLRNARTLTDAIDYVPGALTESRGRKVKQFTSFRGQRYPYPDYAVNGMWQREFHEMPYFFPASQIERVEVVRSSAALLMGLSGQAGVINIIPRRYSEPTTYGELEYGTYNSMQGTLSHGGPFTDGDYRIAVGHRSTDGPANANAAERMTHAGGTVAWQCSEDFRLEANTFAITGLRELRRAEAPAGNRFQTTDERFDPFTAVGGHIRGLYRQSDSASTELSVSYTDRSHDFESTTDGAHVSTDERDYEYGFSVIQALAPMDDNILRVGALYNRWVAPDGKRFYVGRRNDLHTLSGVIVDEHDFGRLQLNGGVRVSQTYIDEYGAFNIEGSGAGFGGVDPVQDEWDAPVFRYSTGARYELDDNLSLSLNVAGGVVEPRSGTLDVDLQDPGNEIRTSVDAGVRMESDDLGWVSIAAFYVLRDDAILLSGETYTTDDGRELELYLNRDLLQYGVELEARSVEFRNAVGLFGNATVMDSQAKVDGDYESYKDVPDVIVAAGVYTRAGRADVNLFGKYVSCFESSRFAADGEPHDLGDFVALNLTAGYRLGRDGGTRLYASVENLTDEEFSTVVGYPDFGRRVYGGVQHTF